MSNRPLAISKVFEHQLLILNEIPDNLKVRHKEFFDEFFSYFTHPIHNRYYSEKKENGDKNLTCSVCRQKTAQNLTEVETNCDLCFFKTIIVAHCDNKICVNDVENYVHRIQENFGPYYIKELSGKGQVFKKNLFIDKTQGWAFKQLSIKLNQNFLEVFVHLEQTQKSTFYGCVTLSTFLLMNSNFKASEVLKNLPDTTGGRYIISYINDFYKAVYDKQFLYEFIPPKNFRLSCLYDASENEENLELLKHHINEFNRVLLTDSTELPKEPFFTYTPLDSESIDLGFLF